MKKFFNGFEDNFCAILLAIMTVITFVNVVARYVFLASMPWVEELCKLGLVILTYCGAATALKRGAHLGLTLVTERLPQKVQYIIDIAGYVVGLVLSGFVIKYGIDMTVKAFEMNMRTQGMQWPEYLFEMWLPIGFVIIAVRFVQLIIDRVKKIKAEGEGA